MSLAIPHNGIFVANECCACNLTVLVLVFYFRNPDFDYAVHNLVSLFVVTKFHKLRPQLSGYYCSDMDRQRK